MTTAIERAKAAMNDAEEFSMEAKELIRDLLAIVERLPVTADGVPVVPEQDIVWVYEDGYYLHKRRIVWRYNPKAKAARKNGWWTSPIYGHTEWSELRVSECYSSVEAAEAARKR